MKTFKQLTEYLGGFRLGSFDTLKPMADLGDKEPYRPAGQRSLSVGINASYSTQAPGTMRPFLTAQQNKVINKIKKKYDLTKNQLAVLTRLPMPALTSILNSAGSMTQYLPMGEELTEDRKLTKPELDAVEKYADRLFAKVGLDVEFSNHFVDRVNDVRNRKQITQSELIRLFKKSYSKYKSTFKNLPNKAQAVLNDIKTDINMPFVIQLDRNGELDMVAKTIMRKRNFATSNKKLTVEEVELMESVVIDFLKGLLPRKLKHALYRAVHSKNYKVAIDKYRELKREIRKNPEKIKRQLGHIPGFQIGNLDNLARGIAAEFAGISHREFNKILDRATRYEDTKRVPRKYKSQDPDKHSDLYTDEDPKDTIKGLGFVDGAKARESINIIDKSGRPHAHKIQAAMAMHQRARVAADRAKNPETKKNLGDAESVYHQYIEKMKKITIKRREGK